MRRCISNTQRPKASRRAPDVDTKFLAWGRATASRGRPRAAVNPPPSTHSANEPGDDGGANPRYRNVARIPSLWLFTDSKRLPDPRAAVARLPRGLVGVVFRHDDHPSRASLGRDLARICRARRLLLIVAGDVRLAIALKAGVHLRGGRWPGPLRTKSLVTSSAHSVQDLWRAMRAGACLAFLSPVFATASHPGASSLGPVRWSALARVKPIRVAALGGIDGVTVRRLPPRICGGAGAIGALA
jgi:thiamine-phosphate pyrophosphorylase